MQRSLLVDLQNNNDEHCNVRVPRVRCIHTQQSFSFCGQLNKSIVAFLQLPNPVKLRRSKEANFSISTSIALAVQSGWRGRLGFSKGMNGIPAQEYAAS